MIRVVLSPFALMLLLFAPEIASAQKPVRFIKDVLPILKESCFQCHNAENPKNGLDLTRYETLRTGGGRGDPIVPGKSDESYLIDVLKADDDSRMPPNASLSLEQIAVIERWIAEGAHSGQKPISFIKDVLPILKESCFGCHGVKNPKGGFDMTRYKVLRAGGAQGDPIVPGKPGESYLIDVLKADDDSRMPPNGSLPLEKIAAIERWIVEGARLDSTLIPNSDLQNVRPLVVRGVNRRNEPRKEIAFDPAQLVGTWTCISGEQAGHKLRIEQGRPASLVTITKDAIFLPAGPDQNYMMGYTIDLNANPVAIDLVIKKGPTFQGAQAVGIVEPDGDRIKLCYTVAPKKGIRRPTKCESTQENQAFLFVLKWTKK